MTYATGQLIQISDFNSLRTSVDQIYGVGNGEFGYGQTAIAMPSPVTTADLVRSSQWKPTRDIMQVCANHQGTAVALPVNPELHLNSIIKASPRIPTAATNITTNRHVAPAPSMTTFSNAASTAWSTNWVTNIHFAFEALWTTADKCRY